MDDCHTLKLSSADGTSLFARHWQAVGARASLLIVHGLGEHSGRYAHFAQHMADNGVDVFAVDLRGHGRSEGKRGVIRSYDDFRADLAALLDYVRGKSPARPLALFGHSMGGGIVLDHGLDPDPLLSGIIASAPFLEPSQAIPPLQRRAVQLGARLAPSASLKGRISSAAISNVPAEQIAYAEDPLNHDRLGLRTAVAIFERGESMQEQARQTWSLPLLMLHSRDDQLCDFGASEAFGQAVGADFRAFSKVQHELHNDTSRSAVYRAVLGFIGKLR